MKKAVFGLIVTLLLTSMLALSFNIQQVEAEPRTWTVDDDGPADFHTIQEAINNANQGDTIYVRNGTYNEHVWILSKINLRIVGEDKNNVIIDGNGYGPIVSMVGGLNVTFAHFTVRNAGWTSWQSDNGVGLEMTQSCQVTDCVVSGCAYGIREMSEWGHLGKNVISGNTVSDCTEVAIGSSHAYSMSNIVANNTIMNNTKFGIYFNNPYNIQILGNHVFGTESQYNHVGIHLQVGGLNNTIIGNRVEYSDFGIRLDYADSNVVEGNAVENCTDEAFVGVGSTDNIIAGNNVSGSIIGFALRDESNDNLVTNNLATNNGNGIVLSSSNGNRIFLNNFMNNTNQAQTDSSVNVWDDGYPSGGNYWSDYSGADEFHGPNQNIPGSDGKGDSPYIIDEENVDHYPLMNPWSVITATLDVEPRTLNLGSKSEWITAYIELPEGYNVGDVDVSTLRLNMTFPAELEPTTIGDHDNDTIPDLMARFNRTSVSEFIRSEGLMTGNVTLTATGNLADGTPFQGSDVITVRMPGDVNVDGKVDGQDIALAAMAFGSCPGYPRWNCVVDENEDNKIDGKDIVLIALNFGKAYP